MFCAPSEARTEGEGFDEPVELRDAHPGDTLYPVQINGSWGHMNQKGHLVVVPRFDWTDYFLKAWLAPSTRTSTPAAR